MVDSKIGKLVYAVFSDGAVTINEFKRNTKLEAKGASLAVSRVNIKFPERKLRIAKLRLIKIKILPFQDQSSWE